MKGENMKECKVFNFAGFTVIPTCRLSEKHTPALLALIGTGINRPGGWYIKKNCIGKYDIIGINGGIIERNLSYRKAVEYKKQTPNKLFGEVRDLFDNILIFQPGRGGYRPYREDETIEEDSIANAYAQILYDEYQHWGGESNHNFSISDVLEKAREEICFVIENGNKSLETISSDEEEREVNNGYTIQEIQEMEHQYREVMA